MTALEFSILISASTAGLCCWHQLCPTPRFHQDYLCVIVLQSLKQREAELAEQERVLQRATDAAQQQNQQQLKQEEALAAATKQLEADKAALALRTEELERQRKNAEAARRALNGVEGALDAREAQLQDSWQLLHASVAALKAGDVAAAAQASAIVVGMVGTRGLTANNTHTASMYCSVICHSHCQSPLKGVVGKAGRVTTIFDCRIPCRTNYLVICGTASVVVSCGVGREAVSAQQVYWTHLCLQKP